MNLPNTSIWPTQASVDFLLGDWQEDANYHDESGELDEMARTALRAALCADPIIIAAVRWAQVQGPTARSFNHIADLYNAIESAGLL
jgi:hypothetical protein